MIRTCAQLSGICFLALAFIAVISQPLAAADATAAVDFQKQIRHLLSDRCFACHGPDAEQRQGAIRFDQKESAFGTGDSGQTAIVPGEPEKSELVARITSQDPDVMMPPPESNKKLTPEEQQLIAEWIRQGANWEEHWAYRIPSRPETPAGAPVNWQAPLDALLWQRMQTKGLFPASPAEREVLIRRATLDLTGLPPTLEEIDAFLNDKSPDAYERLLDRLLESPRYGEHQAHYWLDAARYGDTHGLHLDNYREMWPYRDWVIQAFNNNMPYDQFLKEQLAGDLLENPTEAQIIATGFNRCNVTTSEGGSIAEEVYVRNVVDRVNTFGTVFLGATLDCTRCHDHKFDPFTMHDYYSLFAYFNSIDGSPLDGNRKDHAPVVMVPDESQKQELQQLDQQLAKVNADLQKLEPELNQLQKEWEDRAGKANSDTNWLTLKPTSFRGVNGTTLTLQEDLSLLASGTNPAQETYEVIAEITQGPMWTVRLEGLIDPTLTNGGAGRSSNSNVVLTGFECYLAPASDPENWQPVSIARAAADHEQSNGDFKIENALDD
ncbi:MAG: DUF1549 domain-containing protein, partial [Planctomycetaceae bacterium]|nr:DUF1549 domain-containing protein [Planctomycetaceae bacterium]